jgi:hypothetical protein
MSFPSGRRRGATILLTLAGLWLAPAAGAAETPDLSGACTDPDGVTVVLDSTELGGGVEVGCAASASTGSEALTAAGFEPTKDASGLICAIASLPDPCPATFTGSYWSYWFATPDGEWQMYLEGADTAVPQPGNLEGWRYGDGTAGPAASPADVTAPEASDAEVEVASSALEADTAIDDAAVEPATDGLPGWVVALVCVAGAAGLVAVGIGLNRRRTSFGGESPDGPSGQD